VEFPFPFARETTIFSDMSVSAQPQYLPPAWAIPIQAIGTNVMDEILYKIVRKQRIELQNGGNLEDVLGSVNPNVRGIVDPIARGIVDPTILGELHPVVSVLSEMTNRIAIRGLAERLGSFYHIYTLMRWQIYPSITTYNFMSEWMTPRVSQLYTPHPLWVSYLVFPKLRDEIIANQKDYASDNFMHDFITSIRANWPYPDAAIYYNDGKEVKLTNEFVAHIRKESNWSQGPPFSISYPHLSRCVRFT
jgi:hypothetical protein